MHKCTIHSLNAAQRYIPLATHTTLLTCLVGVHLEAARPLWTPADASMGGVRAMGARSHAPCPKLPRPGAGTPREASGAARAAAWRFAHGLPPTFPMGPREGAHASSERNGMGWTPDPKRCSKIMR